MNRSQILLTLGIIIAFPILFGGIWSGVCYMISAIGGWQSLSKKYEAPKDTFVDQKFTDENGRFGLSNYKFTLTVGFSNAGIFFANNPFFRIGHPPLLIPWREVKLVSANGMFLQLQIDNTNIWLNSKFLSTIQQHLR
ncbi:hypothetical protein [Emticicia fontis]